MKNIKILEDEAILKNNVVKISKHKLVKIAYFIMVHRFSYQFKRLFTSIYDPDNTYLIHIDKKSESKIKKEILEHIKSFDNVFIIEAENVVWGGYSMVEAELKGIQYLLDKKKDWEYFINLSGQDYPLKSQKKIRTFLTINKGKNYLKLLKQEKERPDTLNRIENHFTELESSISPITFKRNYMKDVTPYIGGQWMVLTKKTCEFICNNPEVKIFENYYKNTLIPDESFFQTVLMNTSYSGVIINDDKRAIIWIPDGDIKLRPKTFTLNDLDYLENSKCFFARKFDDKVDHMIIDRINSFMN